MVKKYVHNIKHNLDTTKVVENKYCVRYEAKIQHFCLIFMLKNEQNRLLYQDGRQESDTLGLVKITCLPPLDVIFETVHTLTQQTEHNIYFTKNFTECTVRPIFYYLDK